MRLLVLCSHNSARSQMAEGWLRHYAGEFGPEAEICSAGTEKTFVKPDAVAVMAEVGVDIGNHTSKPLDELPDRWNFDVVITVRDSAQAACPVYPAATRRLHLPFPDPSGSPPERWRAVRDALCSVSPRSMKASSGRVGSRAGAAPTARLSSKVGSFERQDQVYTEIAPGPTASCLLAHISSFSQVLNPWGDF